MTFDNRLPCSPCFTAPLAFICVVGSQISWRGSNVIFCINAYPFVLFARAQSFFEVFYPVCQSYDFSRHLFLLKHYSFTVHLRPTIGAVVPVHTAFYPTQVFAFFCLQKGHLKSGSPPGVKTPFTTSHRPCRTGATSAAGCHIIKSHTQRIILSSCLPFWQCPYSERHFSLHILFIKPSRSIYSAIVSLPFPAPSRIPPPGGTHLPASLA